MNYDLIGDIHGHATELVSLLEKLGYQRLSEKGDCCYAHPNRVAVFLGDFVDRGPEQREVIDIVRPMVEKGSALAVMGNHEFNAIAFYTPDPDHAGEYLRKRTANNKRQHQAFLDAYEDDECAWADTIAWFKTLPLWLDLGNVRVVHACWDDETMARLSPRLGPNNTLTDDLVISSARRHSRDYCDIELLLKGLEIPLPKGISYLDKEGHKRTKTRTCWWRNEPGTFRDIAIVPSPMKANIPDIPVDGRLIPGYSEDLPLVVLGHYWMGGTPEKLAPNIVCVDYSVAKTGGQLVAFCTYTDQESEFIAVDAVE